MSERYATSGNVEAHFEPGSDERVLANKLGVPDPGEMDDIELDLLDQLYDAVVDSVTAEQRITAADLCEWHRRWLGNVYVWAGRYRSVNLVKAEFPFAASAQVPRLMQQLNDDELKTYTPCDVMSENVLAEAIARVHIELILIHPFREGNGRLARLLADVMALQAGWPDLDFSSWDANKDAYIYAIQAGLDDYEPMTQLVRQVLRESLRRADG